MIVLHIVAAIIVPERGVEDGQELAATAYARPVAAGSGVVIFGAILIAIGLAGFAREFLHIEWDLLWPFALIGIGAGFILLTIRR